MKILLADPDPDVRMTMGDALHDAGHHVFLADSAARARTLLETATFDVLITGLNGTALLDAARAASPRTEALVLVADGAETDGAEALRRGAVDVIHLSVGPAEPTAAQRVLARLAQIAEQSELRGELERLKGELAARYGFQEMIGRGDAMQSVFAQAEAARELTGQDAPVLITGERGTGKKRLAKAIHLASRRRANSWVRVSCAVTAARALERELFGDERGGGCFQRAAGDTVFLDDVERLPLAHQDRLWRLLRDYAFNRPGDERERPIASDIRIIATTTADLQKLQRRGRWRGELQACFDGMTIHLPPLRERLEDLPALVEHFIAAHGGGNSYTVARKTFRRMASYPWPGNVGELETAVQRALVYAEPDDELSERYLVPAASARRKRTGTATARPRPLRDVLAEAESNHIAYVLRLTDGNRTRAAEVLGISRKGLWEKMKASGLL